MKQRIITAALAGIFFLGLAVIGGVAFSLLVILMALVGYLEFLRMRKINPYSFPAIIGFILVIFIVPRFEFSLISPVELIMAAFLLLLIHTVLSKNAFHFDQASFIMLASLYVGFGFHYLIEARVSGNGISVLLFILLLIWTTDSGAYFTGRAMGKRKLWPRISPKKTIEGAIGGIVAALIVAVLYQLLFSVSESMVIVVLSAFVIAVFSQIGDLVESAFKRHYGVKDSGSFLPGHGGILDRCDSWLFVLPIMHLFHFI
ncbi:MAG TPA: phosphatidate cytidylyltransferase [Bacillales bacterium]|nr:phosphatidate cytidylyltransferase [Bacillales bacterium]